MNNSSMRFYTLASCGGLLALTACGSQEATTPPVEPTESAKTPPPKVNLRSQSVLPLPRSASGPELSPGALAKARAIALSGGTSPFSDEEIQNRLQQARLKREQLAKSRSSQLQGQWSSVASPRITMVPQRPVNLNPSLPKPFIPAAPPLPTLQGETRVTTNSPAPAQIPTRTLSPVAPVSTTPLEPASLTVRPATSPLTVSACPSLVRPIPAQISLATAKAATSTPGPAATSATHQLPSPQPEAPKPAMDQALETPHHQSYSASRGTFPCLTATRLPSQAMRIHSQALSQNRQEGLHSSNLPFRGGQVLWTSLGVKVLSPAPAETTENQNRQASPSQSRLAQPETTGHSPGFSSGAQASPAAATSVAPDQDS
jgi:hypothetical protein